MFRVRTLIPYLEYGALRKEKVLPTQALFTKVAKGGKFSTIAEKMGYSEFGLFMEIIIREAVICSQEPLLELFENCREHVPPEVHKYYKPKDYVEVGKLVREHFGESGMPTFEPEWAAESDGIVGHPDVVTEDCVYDIKTTGRFNAMRTQTIFQILSYYCLAQINNLKIKYVGLILPSQLKIFKVDLKGWDWRGFWERMKACIELKHQRESLYALPLLEHGIFRASLQRVGGHVEKKHLEGMLSENLPLQFFVGGRVSTKLTSLTKTFTTKLKNRLYPPIFIHAPYNINLSKPKGVKPREEDDKLDIPWTCYQTREILRTGDKAGINGVVVHCGKQGGLSEEEAVKWLRHLDPREWVKEALSLDYKKLGRDSIDGLEVEGVEVVGSNLTVAPLRPNRPNVTIRFWVDIKTRLPVRYEARARYDTLHGDWAMVVDQIYWNVHLDPNIFEPKLPVE